MAQREAVGCAVQLGHLKLPRLEERKHFVLETLRRLKRPITTADLASNPVDQELYRPALRALAEEGIIKRRPGSLRGRAFYDLTQAHRGTAGDDALQTSAFVRAS